MTSRTVQLQPVAGDYAAWHCPVRDCPEQHTIAYLFAAHLASHPEMHRSKIVAIAITLEGAPPP